MDGFNQWPTEDHEFREIIENYYSQCTQLSLKILSAIAVYLGKDLSFFDNIFVGHSSFLRLNFYPDSVIGDGDGNTDQYGVSRHTDAGVLTVLLQVIHTIYNNIHKLN